MSGSGSGTVDVAIVFLLEETTEVGVDIHIQLEPFAGFEYGAFVDGCFEILHDGLDHGGVFLGGSLSKAAYLTYGECYVCPCVGGQVQKHSTHSSVRPCFVHGLTIFVSSECGRSGGSPVRVAIFHHGSSEYLLNESSLGHFD